jgi:hypothetical protein
MCLKRYTYYVVGGWEGDILTDSHHTLNRWENHSVSYWMHTYSWYTVHKPHVLEVQTAIACLNKYHMPDCQGTYHCTLTSVLFVLKPSSTSISLSLCSSGLLHSVSWFVLRWHIWSNRSWPLKMGTNMLPGNTSNKPTYAAQQPEEQCSQPRPHKSLKACKALHCHQQVVKVLMSV